MSDLGIQKSWTRLPMSGVQGEEPGVMGISLESMVGILEEIRLSIVADRALGDELIKSVYRVVDGAPDLLVRLPDGTHVHIENVECSDELVTEVMERFKVSTLYQEILMRRTV